MDTKLRAVFACFLMLVLLAACSGSAPTASTALTVATPAAGKAVVTGRILSAKTGQPYVGEYIFLAVVEYNDKGEGAYFLDSLRSPATQSGANGVFQFTDLAPRDYVVIVGEPTGRTAVLTDISSGNPKIWKVEAGKVLNMGDMKFDLGY